MKKSSRTRLIIMAHPDDPELACGGTIALWTKSDTVHYILITSGDKGTWAKTDSPFITAHEREKETHQAAKYLGVKKIVFLRHPDGMLDNIHTIKLELAALIRHIKPDTIVTHDPWRIQFHPDHRSTGFIVIKSVMIARDWHFYPALYEIGLKPHRPKELLLTPTDSPNVINNISSTFEKKLKAIKKHKSQLSHLYNWEGRITRRAREVGKNKGFKYAEAFHRFRI